MQHFKGTATAVATLIVAACGAAPTNQPGEPGMQTGVDASNAPEASTPAPPRPVDIARQKATEAYVGMWRDMAAAATTSDWQSPTIARHATGDALGVITRSLRTDHTDGVVTRGEPVNHPHVSTVDSTETPALIMITDCGDSTHWLKYRLDGEPFDDTPGGRRSITAEVKLQSDGSWKVTRFAVQEVGTC